MSQQAITWIAIFGPITFASTALRLVARARKRTSLGGDDYFAIGAFVSFMVFVGLEVWGGKTYDKAGIIGTPQFDYVQFARYLRSFYIASVFTTTPISLAKFSILWLYYRVFASDRKMRFAVLATAAICVLWWIAATIAVGCTCLPAEHFWNTMVPGSCFDYQRFYIGIEIPNCILDFWVVILPIWEITKLQLRLQDKIGISFIFLMAGFVGVISIVRMVIVYHNPSPLNPETAFWITMQLGFRVLCCNLPVYRPLLPSAPMKDWFSSLNSLLGGSRSRSTYKSGPSQVSDLNSRQTRRARYDNLPREGNDKIVLTWSETGTERGSSGDRDFPMNSMKRLSDGEGV